MTKQVIKIDIDVIGDFPRFFDKAIDAFHGIIRNPIVAGTAKEMVEKILERLQPAQGDPTNYVIGRLSIYGHGNGNYVALSRFEEIPDNSFVSSIDDFTPGTYKRALAAKVLGFDTDEKFWFGNNDAYLEKLVGKFASDAYVKIVSCHIAPGVPIDLSNTKIKSRGGLTLMKGLAMLWKVTVAGGSANQNPTPGLEGEVYIAYPDGIIKKEKTDPFLKQETSKKLDAGVASPSDLTIKPAGGIVPDSGPPLSSLTSDLSDRIKIIDESVGTTDTLLTYLFDWIKKPFQLLQTDHKITESASPSNISDQIKIIKQNTEQLQDPLAINFEGSQLRGLSIGLNQEQLTVPPSQNSLADNFGANQLRDPGVELDQQQVTLPPPQNSLSDGFGATQLADHGSSLNQQQLTFPPPQNSMANRFGANQLDNFRPTQNVFNQPQFGQQVACPSLGQNNFNQAQGMYQGNNGFGNDGFGNDGFGNDGGNASLPSQTWLNNQRKG